MTEVEKKGIGKSKIGLLASSVLIVILVISSLWLYTRINSLQNQVNALETDKDNLQNQINSLQTWLDGNITEIDSLKTPQLHKVNVEWSDHHPWFASPYISTSGCIFNSGTYSAYNVVLTVKIYDSADTLLKSEELIFGTISGKSYKNFDTTIEYSGNAYYVLTTLTYD